jgi:hypothetical protein
LIMLHVFIRFASVMDLWMTPTTPMLELSPSLLWSASQ